jgi:hypothetical protein
MILFYSISCQHCSVLLDTIKRHDTKKTIKLVCIDCKISLIKTKITNVPALMFLPSKEIIYGKAVFDYLLLPNRGYLFSNNTTREKDKTPSSITAPIPLNTSTPDANEPISFSLGRIGNDTFSDINDNDFNSINIDTNRNYVWELIDNKNNNQVPIQNLSEEYKTKSEKKLPSLEELTKERENLFKDIK